MEKIYCSENEEQHSKLYSDIVNREKLEQKAIGSLTSEKLKKLNMSLEDLPQKWQNMLQQTADMQSLLQIEQLDSESISLYQTRNISAQLKDDYEILKLRQKNTELQVKIDRNNKFLLDLRQELVSSKKSLASQNPNPNNIQEYIRQMKQKLKSYEDSYEKVKRQYADLSVPETILPKSLNSQIALLLKLKEEELSLKQDADDALMVKEAKDLFNKLKK